MKTPSDQAYQEFIRRQRSCLSGQFSEYVHGEGRCIAAHVRRAKNSGTGYKGLFSCVPLTNDEHQMQHRLGELGVLRHYVGLGLVQDRIPATVAGAKEWFDGQVEKYRVLWEASL